VLVVVAYFPFAWSPPRTVANQAARNADDSLRFGEMNYARTVETPAWLEDARVSGVIRIKLEAEPQSLSQSASVMILGSDYWTTNFCICQDGSDLVVWVRRPGSDVNGGPPFTVGRVFQSQRWTSVTVTLQQGDLRIEVDGQTRLSEQLPVHSLGVWSQGQIALGDEVHGGGPWRGQIRVAEVRTARHTVDYVRPGALSIPATYRYLPDHIEPFPPLGGLAWLTALLDLLSFIPLGFLIVLARDPPIRLIPATLFAAGLAVALGAGKFFFEGRHTAVLNIFFEIIGAFLGVLLARAWDRHVSSSRATL
jgi:Concanavalin A-like lectin/glucanases superfamily